MYTDGQCQLKVEIRSEALVRFNTLHTLTLETVAVTLKVETLTKTLLAAPNCLSALAAPLVDLYEHTAQIRLVVNYHNGVTKATQKRSKTKHLSDLIIQ